jgi:hypothetical protein
MAHGSVVVAYRSNQFLITLGTAAREPRMRPEQHLGCMPHLDMALSKWDASMGTLELNVDVRRYLRHDLAAVGKIFGTSERRFNGPGARECSPTQNGPMRASISLGR